MTQLQTEIQSKIQLQTQIQSEIHILEAKYTLQTQSLITALSIKWVVQSFEEQTSFWSSSYFCIFVIFTSGLFQGILSQATSHHSVLAGIRAKNALLVLFYGKILTLPVVELKNESNEEDDHEDVNESNLDLGHATNLATEDVSNVKEVFWNLQYIWALPLKMFVIGVLIHQSIGPAGSIGTACGVLVIVPLQLFIGKLMSGNNKKIQEQR